MGGSVGDVCTFLVRVSFDSFYLASAYMFCTVSGAVNTQDFVWTFFERYIYINVHSFILSLSLSLSLPGDQPNPGLFTTGR